MFNRMLSDCLLDVVCLFEQAADGMMMHGSVSNPRPLNQTCTISSLLEQADNIKQTVREHPVEH
jgi:hypothetical protein